MKKITTIDKIQSHMKEKGLKYKWLCAKIGVSTGHFSNILSGIKRLTPEMVDKINKILGTSFKL